MRNCDFCDKPCDSDIGMYRELKTQYWGGKRTGVEYSPKLVSFFCSDKCRSDFQATGLPGGEVQFQKEIRFDA